MNDKNLDIFFATLPLVDLVTTYGAMLINPPHNYLQFMLQSKNNTSAQFAIRIRYFLKESICKRYFFLISVEMFCILLLRILK